MNSIDLGYLQNALSSFIDASIQRVAHSGDLIYWFRITAAELKAATGRQRLHDTVIGDCVAFFESYRVTADYDENFQAFNIKMDLNFCVLDPQQAAFLSTAMNTFRAENM
jgi:hypothetical protein